MRRPDVTFWMMTVVVLIPIIMMAHHCWTTR
jgi:hypothetical protein